MAYDRPLRDQPERQINASIAAPLNVRLDALVELARRAGENTNRREVISALVLQAPTDGDALAEWLRRYRRALIRDALVPGFDEASFLDSTPHGPGPRPRRREAP
jgi:hypothetical protein